MKQILREYIGQDNTQNINQSSIKKEWTGWKGIHI